MSAPELSQDVVKEVESKKETVQAVKKCYRYWRIRIFYSIYIGYALFYFTRKSFTFIMPALVTELHFAKSELGFLGSLLAISYGVSKFVSGVLSDRCSVRYFMSMGLILTGVANLLCGFSSSMVLFALLLVINGFFQGWGAPPCAKLLTYWYSQKERGRWWGIWNTSHNIGGALIPLICAMIIRAFNWHWAMYVPGVLAIIVGLFIMNRLRDKPQSLHLPPVDLFKGTGHSYTKRGEEEREDSQLSLRENLIKSIFKNTQIWILAISFFFVYVIRTAVNDWVQLYLMERKGYSLMVAGSCIFWFEIGGIIGSLAAGWLSDILFKGKRGPVNVLFSLSIIVMLLALWVSPQSNLFLVSGVMFLVGFVIFGPQMLIGMAAAESTHKTGAGTATGFVGFFAYLGAAVAGYPVGKITQDYGWLGFFVLLGGCALITTSLLIPLWSKKGASQLLPSG